MVDQPHAYATALVVLSVILAASIAADFLAARLRLPRISLLVVLGVGFGMLRPLVVPNDASATLDSLAEPLIVIALVMVAFLLGGELTAARMRAMGKLIVIISLAVVVASVVVVGVGLLLLGFPLALALSLGAIAAATDPAAVHEVVRESGERRSPRGELLLGIVAIDDAWGIVAFGVTMAALGLMLSGDGLAAVSHSAWELAGAIALGLAIGVPAALLSGRLRRGQPTQIEALAVVLCIAGLSASLEVSPLLAAMTAGVTVANLSVHHTRSFREIEQIEWPFLVFFFVLAGARLDLSSALALALPVTGFIVLRVLGRLAGGWAGVRLAGAPRALAHPCIGLALTPQAGIAMGMALLSAERYPDVGPVLVAVAVTSTVVFETLGPLLTRWVLRRHGRV